MTPPVLSDQNGPMTAAQAPGVVEFREGHVEAEAEPLGLWDDVNKVGLGLIGDVELEHLLGHVGI